MINMKKTFALMIAVFAMIVAFTSCEKEGQYMPKKKISRVVYTHSHKVGDLTISTTESERWVWGKDQLNYIDVFNSDGDKTNTFIFRYDEDNRMEEVEDKEYTVKYDYDDGHLDEIEIKNKLSGRLLKKMEFSYKGSKLATIDVTTDSKGNEPLSFNPLRFVIPDEIAEMMLSNDAAKGTVRYTVTWSGKNISGITSDAPDRSYVKWTYDEMNNPFKGFFNTAYGLDEMYSANNAVREEYSTDGKVSVIDYNYEYSGKYPTKVKYQTESSTLVPGYTLTVDNEITYQY